MPDLRVIDDPFSRPFELTRPISSITFPDGEGPFEFQKTPQSTAIPDPIIAMVENLGRQCPNFFGDRRPEWQRLNPMQQEFAQNWAARTDLRTKERSTP